ncbi:4a-hydroxytetrahydrobiopterin dehydratase [Nocardioides sp. P86]|uniref:4a-hydroxytetrahydrobiopterin dehydratase n=1 Tax=Nocardioides sp. P86 TaxID=2939569 RepID=UPI0020422B51|nr:4a-hydroxytetrahydrobiopterin dehydratase [Nocardioides sp. P86]MCM3514297.1 4a-hydroxytetrahydrobiopterin dehydratase [Nocardioides sp. P86]
MSSDTTQTDTTDDQQTDPDKQVLTGHDVAEALLEEWRFVLGRLHARFRTGDFSTGARLVAAIADAADAVDHHPDVDLRYPHVDVVLSSHDVGGITRRDLRLAATITDLAGQVGAEPAPHEVQALEWALDTPDPSRIKPFWAAVLGLDPSAGKDDEVLDGDGRSALWFQRSTDSAADGAADGATDSAATGSDGGNADRAGTSGQRFHLDVTVPPELAEKRVRVAVEAGGTLVNDGYAPAFWVLADAEGNHACVCTWLGRDGSATAPPADEA